MIAGENLEVMDFVYFGDDGKLYKARKAEIPGSVFVTSRRVERGGVLGPSAAQMVKRATHERARRLFRERLKGRK